MKRKMSLEDELDVTRTSVAELTGWCITIALHDLFGIGRERLNRVNNRQRMLAEQSMAIMMQPNERGMPSTEKARRMRAEALPESVPREFRVPALRAARNRREQQLKIVGDRAATMAWQLDVTRTSVAELTGWCITIALHDLFGIGRERLNRVNNRQRMLAEQSMAIMMQPNERGMPSTEKARRMRAEALPESVPREFRVPALRAARNRREQQLKIVGDRAATMAWQLHARACMEVLGFGPDRLNRLYDEMRHNYDQMNTWGKEDGIDVAMERMRKCACDALKTDDIVVEDVEDSKELAAQRQHYHAQEVEFLRRAALAATGRKSCAKVLNVFDAGAMDRKMAAVRDAAVGEAFRRRV